MAQVIRGYHGDTLICDSYAATRILPPDRPEPPRPDPREDRISHDELLRAEGWTDDDLSRAQRYVSARYWPTAYRVVGFNRHLFKKRRSRAGARTLSRSRAR